MKRLLFRLRCFLLRKLAGKSMFIINADISGIGLTIWPRHDAPVVAIDSNFDCLHGPGQGVNFCYIDPKARVESRGVLSVGPHWKADDACGRVSQP